MEKKFTVFIDKIIEKNKNNTQLAISKVKEFLEIAKDVGGLTNVEMLFITRILTDENIVYMVENKVSCEIMFNIFAKSKTAPEKRLKVTQTSNICGSLSFSERRKNISRDRCGEGSSSNTSDRCGSSNTSNRCGGSSSSSTSDRCGGGSSRGC